jgi:TRAP-type C4-dicarboxylate transport system permease small subunit
MFLRFSTAVERVVEAACWMGFLALILTVGFQVFARNILKLPFVWTMDLAQLLFAWLIFVGAAVAFRRGGHYAIDIFPETWTRWSAVLNGFGVAASLCVIYVLVRYGWTLVEVRQTSEVQTLGITEAWFFLPIPVCGGLMLLFLVENLVRAWKGQGK